MSIATVLSADEIELVSGGMGFFQRLGWAYDNPGEAIGIGLDRAYRWYKLSPNEDPALFIG